MPTKGPSNRAATSKFGFFIKHFQYVLVVDGDVEFADPEALNCMLTHCIREGVGVVGAKTLFADDTIRHAGMMVGRTGSASEIGVNMPRSARGYWGVCSALAMFRRFPSLP